LHGASCLIVLMFAMAGRVGYSPSPAPMAQMTRGMHPAVHSWVPPKAATGMSSAMIRASSYEAPVSRGVSPTHGGPSLGMYKGVASPPMSSRKAGYPSVSSPPPSHRSVCHVVEPISSLPPGSHPMNGPPSRFASRSPPPQRLASGSSQRLEPAACRSAPAILPRRSLVSHALGSNVTHLQHSVSRSTSVPSTQSLSHAQSLQRSRRPSAANCPSGRNSSAPSTATTVPVMPASRAHSASTLPASGATPAIASMPTLATASQAPPLAQVLPLQPNANRAVSSDDLEQRLHSIDNSAHRQLQHRITQLEEEKEATESKLREAETRVLHEVDELERAQRDLIRARHEIDCEKATNQRLEIEHRTKCDRDEACVEKWKQSCEKYASRCEQLTRHNEQLTQRFHEFEMSEQDLLEKVRQANSAKSSVEAKAEGQVREFNNRVGMAQEAARRIEGEKRMLEAEVERIKHEQKQHYQQVEHKTRELRCDKAVLEDQLRDSQEQRRISEQEKKIAEQDLRQWYQKFIESNKENTGLQRANQDHKRDIWDLENQLRQDRKSASVATPGDYLKMMKAHEHESLATENCKLKKALSKTQCDLDLCIKKLQEQDKTNKDLQDMLHRLQAMSAKTANLEA